MKLGYIHTNCEEQNKVLQVLKMTSESVALDELGIGRLRDAFADLMFPGTSTLQKHLKYFSLMPQLYKKATERRYNRMSEVKAEIIRLERIMTKNLFENSTDRRGITGSDMIGKGGNNYVKYDPAYIYNSGLQTFEILRSSQLYELIFAASKHLHEVPKRLKTEDEDTADDASEQNGLFQFCSFPCVDYDFTKCCSLDLTAEDKAFITEHILNAEPCKGTLLRYIVEHPNFSLAETFDAVSSKTLPKYLADIQTCAKAFADFVYLLHLRYNWLLSNGTDSEILEELNDELEIYHRQTVNLTEVLNTVNIKENSSKVFCLEVEQYMMQDDWRAVDDCIIRREKRVKGTRRKIGNLLYVYNPKNRIHHYKLNFRWDTVRTFAAELRREANHG